MGLYEDLDKTIEIIEKDDSVKVPKMPKADFIAIGVLAGVCLAAIIGVHIWFV